MAAEGPVSSFPMDKEAAEEEIALLVRKPGFDELTPADIVRHMNTRFNLDFEAYRGELKKMVFEQIKKNREDDSSDSSDDDESDKEDEQEEKKEEKVVKEEPVVKKEAKKEPVEAAADSDSDDGIDASERYKPSLKKKRAAAAVVGDMVSNVKSTRRSAASNALKQIRNTSEGGGRYANKKKKEKDPNEDNSGKFGPMTKLCYISPELQQITKDQFMKRCDVVKVMWDYIKEKNLKDPKSGQFFLCDEVLEPIFKKKRVKAFGMTKFLTRHIIGPNDMDPEIRAESEREMEIRRAAMLERKRQREEAEKIDDDDEAGPSKKVKKEEDVSDEDGDPQSSSTSSSSSDSD